MALLQATATPIHWQGKEGGNPCPGPSPSCQTDPKRGRRGTSCAVRVGAINVVRISAADDVAARIAASTVLPSLSLRSLVQQRDSKATDARHTLHRLKSMECCPEQRQPTSRQTDKQTDTLTNRQTHNQTEDDHAIRDGPCGYL